MRWLSFFSSLKNELIRHSTFRTRHEARTAIFESSEVFYNRQRRHQALDFISPIDYERNAGVHLINLSVKPGPPQNAMMPKATVNQHPFSDLSR